MMPGCRPLRTTIAPITAFAKTLISASHDKITIHARWRLLRKENRASNSTDRPKGSEVRRLTNSIQVWTGSKLSMTVSRVIKSGSMPRRSACRLNLLISNFSTSIWSARVGGIKRPQQVGQSGQPRPDPVTRTVAPTTTKTIRQTSVIQAKRWTIMNYKTLGKLNMGWHHKEPSR